MKKNPHILTLRSVFGLLFMLFILCGCNQEFTEGTTSVNGTESTLLLQLNKNNVLTGNEKEHEIKQFSYYLFQGEKLISKSTSVVVPNSGELKIIIPEEYTGERLKAMVVANDVLTVADDITLSSLTQNAITSISASEFKTKGFPMVGEIEFEAKPVVRETLQLKRVYSAFYTKLSGSGDLADFMFIIMGVQQKNAYLFRDNVKGLAATEDMVVGLRELNGKESQPLCYFYPGNEEIYIRVIPNSSKYLGVAPLLVSLPAEKANLKNQKFTLTVSPPTPTSNFSVSLVPWTEQDLEVDISDIHKTELEELVVSVGDANVPLKEESARTYSLIMDGRAAPNLNFALPKGAVISPDPNTALLGGGYRSTSFKIISESGKVGAPFTIKYFPDKVYTLVVLGDTEYGFRGYSKEQAKQDVSKLVGVKKGNYYFKEHPSFKIDPELLMVVGDISGDRNNHVNDFFTVFNDCYNAGIKCMNIYGNHDWDPEFWEFSDGTPDKGDPGFTEVGRKSVRQTKDRVLHAAQRSGIGITPFNTLIGETPYPYYFTYRGVRYYCGNSFWFMVSFEPSPTPFWAVSKLFSTDYILNNLDALLKREGKNYPAIWMHHYPFRSADRWWAAYSSPWPQSKWLTATARRDKMKELIGQSKNPAAFSGHVHYSAVDNYTDSKSGTKFTEYVTPYFRNDGGSGYFVLVSEKEGVLAVQEFNFNNLK